MICIRHDEEEEVSGNRGITLNNIQRKLLVKTNNWTRKKELIQNLMKFNRTFNCVCTDSLWLVLTEYDIDSWLEVEVKIRLVQAHSAMTRLAVFYRNKSNSFPTKIKLYKALVLTILLDTDCRSGKVNSSP